MFYVFTFRKKEKPFINFYLKFLLLWRTKCYFYKVLRISDTNCLNFFSSFKQQTMLCYCSFFWYNLFLKALTITISISLHEILKIHSTETMICTVMLGNCFYIWFFIIINIFNSHFYVLYCLILLYIFWCEVNALPYCFSLSLSVNAFEWDSVRVSKMYV